MPAFLTLSFCVKPRNSQVGSLLWLMGHNISLRCRLGARACLLIEFLKFSAVLQSAHPFRHVKLCLSPGNYLQSQGTAPAAPRPWEELRKKSSVSPENDLLLARKGHWGKSQVWLKIEIELRIRLRMRTENISVADCPPCGNLCSCFQLKSPHKSLVHITPCLLQMTSLKRESPSSF